MLIIAIDSHLEKGRLDLVDCVDETSRLFQGRKKYRGYTWSRIGSQCYINNTVGHATHSWPVTSRLDFIEPPDSDRDESGVDHNAQLSTTYIDSRSRHNFIWVMSSSEVLRQWTLDQTTGVDALASRSHKSTRRRPSPHGRFSLNETAMEFLNYLGDGATIYRKPLLPSTTCGRG